MCTRKLIRVLFYGAAVGGCLIILHFMAVVSNHLCIVQTQDAKSSYASDIEHGPYLSDYVPFEAEHFWEQPLNEPELMKSAPPLITMMNITTFPTSDNVTHKSYYKLQKFIVNNWNFKQIIYEEVCGDKKDLLLVATVITQGGKVDDRKFIRATWGRDIMNTFPGMRMVFITGKQKSPEEEEIIQIESKQFHDIIQFDFIEHYDNLTIKSMLALKWGTEHCPRAKFIIKIDDDVLVNVVKLNNSLSKHSSMYTLIGSNVGGHMTRRKPPWNISSSQFPIPYLPHLYMEGPIYAVSMSAALVLLRTSYYVPYVQLEDVYVTGILPRVSPVRMVADEDWSLNIGLGTMVFIKYIVHQVAKGGRVALHNFGLGNRIHTWNKLTMIQHPHDKRQLTREIEWIDRNIKIS